MRRFLISLALLIALCSCARADVSSPIVFLRGEKDVEERFAAHIESIMEEAEDGDQIVIWQVHSPVSVSVYHGNWSPQWRWWTSKPVGPEMYVLGKI